MTVLIVLACYGAAWLATSRMLYGRWRGLLAGCRNCGTHGTHEQRRYSRGNCCYDATQSSDGEQATYAMLAALVWPAVLVTAVVRFRPPPTAAERDAAGAALKARIAELEREAGVAP